MRAARDQEELRSGPQQHGPACSNKQTEGSKTRFLRD